MLKTLWLCKTRKYTWTACIPHVGALCPGVNTCKACLKRQEWQYLQNSVGATSAIWTCGLSAQWVSLLPDVGQTIIAQRVMNTPNGIRISLVWSQQSETTNSISLQQSPELCHLRPPMLYAAVPTFGLYSFVGERVITLDGSSEKFMTHEFGVQDGDHNTKGQCRYTHGAVPGPARGLH